MSEIDMPRGPEEKNKITHPPKFPERKNPIGIMNQKISDYEKDKETDGRFFLKKRFQLYTYA
jgi:hypothetical protein